MRILIVGPTASYKRVRNRWLSPRAGLMFYCFANRLANGLVRNGHFVMMLNDREARKQTLDLPVAGAWLANRRLLRIANELQPDLLCLQHCDLISTETVKQIRQTIPHCRVAVVHYDSLFQENSAARFRRFLHLADFGFATTGGETLSRFSDACPVAYIPNPVDFSIDNLRAYALVDKPFDVFCACCTTGRANRWAVIDELRRLQPDLRYALHGRNKSGRISGNAYYEAISRAKVGLNLNTDEGDLYASDRMAQYLGNGLLLATSRASGYEQYFEADEMVFFSDANELAGKLEWALSDDDRWRGMAKKGQARAAAIMSGVLVADFIVRMTLGLPVPEGWQFCDQIHCAERLRRAYASMAAAQGNGRAAADRWEAA